MDCIDDQQPNFKHYCRVCKKGFICGRALGGHMRAHDIGYENESFDDDEDDDDDHGSDWEDKLGGSKRMYQLRTNPNRQKSCKNCENCGKEFLCWKSFLEHGKCSSNDVYEPPVSSGEDEGERRGLGWSKKKRTTRTKVGDISSNFPPNEDEDMLLARCLVQLANTIVEPMPWPEQSSSSGSREEERRNPRMFFRGSKAKGLPSPKGLFECKACKKVFNSHQALGGHRASHKKVKGCFAAKQDQYESNVANDDMIAHDQFLFPSKPTSFEQGPALVGAAKRKSKVHECSICHRVFASGQALGGHKRCHWIVSNSSNASPLAKYQPEENMEPSHRHHEPRPTNFAISALDRDPPKYEYDDDDNNNNNSNVIIHKVEDEADSKSKLAKLSELKEMGTSENPSQWLQIGFGSGTEAAADV